MFSFFLKQIRGTQKIVLLSLVCLSNLLYLQTWQVSFIFYIKRHFFIRFLPSFPWTQKVIINFITIYKLVSFVILDYDTKSLIATFIKKWILATYYLNVITWYRILSTKTWRAIKMQFQFLNQYAWRQIHFAELLKTVNFTEWRHLNFLLPSKRCRHGVLIYFS